MLQAPQLSLDFAAPRAESNLGSKAFAERTNGPSNFIPEQSYALEADPEHRKKFGQFFTPPALARIMLDWVLERRPRTLLDPAMGTGIFVREARRRDSEIEVTAFELDGLVASYSGLPYDPSVRVILQDFLSYPTATFDAVVMNPPYIRHREIRDKRAIRELSGWSGVEIPKSANLYIPFNIKACLSLNPRGRAAILIPSEWMNANFSASFKKFLTDRNILREIITFSHCDNLFDGARTTASILLIDNL